MDSTRIEVYAPVIIRLLREVVSSDDRQDWSLLLTHEYAVQEYFNRIGLQVYINRVDGYAYAQQPDLSPDDTAIRLPRLTRSTALTAPQTLLLLLLREQLDEFLNQPQESDDLLLTDQDIYRLMEPYLPDRHDKRKTERTIGSYINQIVEMGFLKVLSAERRHEFIVQRVLRSKVNADLIASLKQQLQEYFTGESNV